MQEYIAWLWDFWVWCAKINLVLMIFTDVKQNKWSTPREYALIVCFGPISLGGIIFYVLMGIYEKLRERYQKR